MKKDKKFLLELEKELKGIDSKSRESIILKYKNIINEKVNKKVKITKVLKELGNPSDIAKEEIKLLINKKPSKIKSFFSFITKDIQVTKKNKKEKEPKKEKKDKEKETKTLIEKITGNKKDLNNEKIIEEKEEIIETKEETFEEKEEIKEELVVENEAKKEIQEIKEEKANNEKTKRERTIKILGTILICLLIFIWLWVNVVTIASFFALLDGVKLYGISIALIGISVIMLIVLISTINVIYEKEKEFKYGKITLLVSVIVVAFGIALSIYEIYKVDCISDVSEKYSMQRKIETYSLPTDENINMYILFNSNYDTQYIVNYDESLSGKVKVEVDYYEAYYDYYAKQSSNNLYISLRTDSRDMISTYISDLKDNKVYSKDELSRYVVKITTSKKDYSRLVIED